MHDGVIERQKLKITPEQEARIRERLNRKPHVEKSYAPNAHGQHTRDPEGSGITKPDRERDAEVKAHKTGKGKPIPSELVAAAVRAADVILPKDLEERVVTIATMYLNGCKAADIAEALDLDVAYVREEIRKLDSARSVAMEKAPEMANKVLETHFDVLKETVRGIEQDHNVLEMIRHEIEMDYADNVAYRQRQQGGGVEEIDTDDSPEGNADENNTRKKPKRRPSISPMKIDAYFRGRETIGKQIDRVAGLLGLLGKHIPEEARNNYTQINLSVDPDKLNSLADMYLKASGQTPTTIREPLRPELRGDIIDVKAEQL